MPFTITLLIGLLVTLVGAVLLIATRNRKAALTVLLTGIGILAVSMLLIKVAVDSMP